MSQSDISEKKMVRIANYIKFYGPTKDELQKEFKLKNTSMRHYLTEIRKTYQMKREIRYIIDV